MKILRILILGFLMAFLFVGCAEKTVSGVYTYRQGNLAAKYIFQPDGAVKYTSNLNGQFYHTKAGDGVYVIQGNQVIVSLHGMMDFTSPFNFQTVFKKDKKDLVELYTVDANGQTNMAQQDRYIGENQ
jgi:hypothetical protein